MPFSFLFAHSVREFSAGWFLVKTHCILIPFNDGDSGYIVHFSFCIQRIQMCNVHSLRVPCYRLKQYCNRILQTCLSIYDCALLLLWLMLRCCLWDSRSLSQLSSCILYSSFSICCFNGKTLNSIANKIQNKCARRFVQRRGSLCGVCEHWARCKLYVSLFMYLCRSNTHTAQAEAS